MGYRKSSRYSRPEKAGNKQLSHAKPQRCSEGQTVRPAINRKMNWILFLPLCLWVRISSPCKYLVYRGCATNLLVNSLKSNGRYNNFPLGLRGIEGVTAIFPYNSTIVTPPHPLLTQEGGRRDRPIFDFSKKFVAHPFTGEMLRKTCGSIKMSY